MKSNLILVNILMITYELFWRIDNVSAIGQSTQWINYDLSESFIPDTTTAEPFKPKREIMKQSITGWLSDTSPEKIYNFNQRSYSLTSLDRYLPPNNCGNKAQLSEKIVGGEDAISSDWPWMVAIGYYDNFFVLLCGGTLITNNLIISAAHCFKDYYIQYVARFSDVDLYGHVIFDEYIKIGIIHRNFSQNINNDIAVVKLNRDITLTASVNPICLPHEPIDGYFELFVAGWGKTEFNGPNSNLLKEAKLSLIDIQKCIKSYQNLIPTFIYDNRFFCAGFMDGHADACSGDSGGPLAAKVSHSRDISNSIYYLFGIVSRGYKCGVVGFPGIYTNVTTFMNFITYSVSVLDRY